MTKMCNSITKNDILSEIDLILDKTFVVNVSITFYKQLKSIKFEEPSKYKICENFFNSTSVAYDYLICCEVPKFFNKNEQRGSIYRIIQLCKDYNNQLSVCCEEKKSLENLLKSIEEKLNQINVSDLKEYRDKYLAHSDKKYFYNQQNLVDNYSFDLDGFNELNKTAIDILTKIYSQISGITHIFCPDMLFNYDLSKIIDRL